MSKLDNLKGKIDGQEGRVDSWAQRLVDSPHTARVFVAVVLVLALVGLVLWLKW